MNTRAVLSFTFGLIFGALAGAAIVAHVLAVRIEQHGREFAGTLDAQQQALDVWQKAATTWQQRAQSCEAKFTTGTIVLEPHPLAEIPVFGGAASVSVNLSADAPRPALFIPAQVRVYTNVPGARYQWQDMRTGELHGDFPALPPSAMAATERVQ